MSDFLTQRQRVTDKVGLLLLARLESPAFPESVCIAADTDNWVKDGVEYIALPFGFKLPDESQGISARAKLIMANVGTDIVDYFENVTPKDQVMATLMLCNRENPVVATHTISLPLTNVSIKGTVITMDAGADFIMRQQAVKLRFNEHTTPGVFQQ